MKKILVVLCGLSFFAFTACEPKGPNLVELQNEQDSLARVDYAATVKADSFSKVEAAKPKVKKN